MLLCAHNTVGGTSLHALEWGGLRGGAMSLCQVACEYVVAVGLGLQFLYSYSGESNHYLNVFFTPHCLKALNLLYTWWNTRERERERDAPRTCHKNLADANENHLLSVGAVAEFSRSRRPQPARRHLTPAPDLGCRHLLITQPGVTWREARVPHVRVRPLHATDDSSRGVHYDNI